MRHFFKIIIYTTTIVILTLSLALAGAKFTNKDTAKSRKDSTFGTEQGEGTGTNVFGTDEDGSSTIKSKARPKAEEVDWYDKIIISVNPDTKWGDSTTTATTYNATGDKTGSTTTTTTND